VVLVQIPVLKRGKEKKNIKDVVNIHIVLQKCASGFFENDNRPQLQATRGDMGIVSKWKKSYVLRGIVRDRNAIALAQCLCRRKEVEFNYLERWLDRCRAI